MIRSRLSLLFLSLLVLPIGNAFGADSNPKSFDPTAQRTLLAHETPAELESVGIKEHLGEIIDLNLTFKNESGQTVRLADLIQGKRPVLLNIVYYGCPNLCNFQLNGLIEGLKGMKWTPGDQFDIISISMDPREGPELAAEKKANLIAELGRPAAAGGWHFLTGTEKEIKAVAGQVGFSYSWDEKGQQYAHSAAAYVLTPEAKISRYLYGIQYHPQTLRLSLLEAGQGKVGNIVDKFIMYCFQFDASKNKYTLYAFNLMKLGAGLFAVLMALILVPIWMREGKRFGTT